MSMLADLVNARIHVEEPSAPVKKSLLELQELPPLEASFGANEAA